MKHQNIITCCGLLALATITAVEAKPRSNSHYDYAEVTAVEPLYRTVRVEQPVRECWDEAVYVPDRASRSHTPVILGGVVGGLLGHELGRKGRHHGLATAAGTVLGASIGRDVRSNHGGGHYRNVERCETRHTTYEEKRSDGFRVSYSYQGQQYTTRTDHNPGKQLRVRVAISPAE